MSRRTAASSAAAAKAPASNTALGKAETAPQGSPSRPSSPDERLIKTLGVAACLVGVFIVGWAFTLPQSRGAREGSVTLPIVLSMRPRVLYFPAFLTDAEASLLIE